MTLRFVFHYPETSGTDGDMLDSGALDDVARAAEAAGFDALALTEHPIPGARWLDTRRPPEPRPVRRARLRRRRHRRGSGCSPISPSRRTGTRSCSPRRRRRSTSCRAGDSSSDSAPATRSPSSTRSACPSTSAARCSTRCSTACRCTGRASRSATRACTSTPATSMALPKPVQDPIPIWIGGNSKAARRRVVERAQGWMPMIGPAELAKTTQTPTLGEHRRRRRRHRARCRHDAEAAGRTEPHRLPDVVQRRRAADADRRRRTPPRRARPHSRQQGSRT